MDKRIELLKKWGCDIESAMKVTLNDEKFYFECLECAVTDENFDGLKNALIIHDINGAFNCAHTIKGVFGNLGLTPIYNEVKEITELLRAGYEAGVLEKTDKLLIQQKKLADILDS